MITCSATPNIVNGTIGYSRLGTTDVFNYGTTAIYQCNHGYKLIGEDSERTCTGDVSPRGRWDGTAPQCLRMFYYWNSLVSHDYVHTQLWTVGLLRLLSMGLVGIPTTTTFTGTVTYSCNDGYALFGIATSTCQANTTWSSPPECRGIYLSMQCLHLHVYTMHNYTVFT